MVQNKKEALEYMYTGRCPFVGEPCPDDLVNMDRELDHVCQKCIDRHFRIKNEEVAK